MLLLPNNQTIAVWLSQQVMGQTSTLHFPNGHTLICTIAHTISTLELRMTNTVLANDVARRALRQRLEKPQLYAQAAILRGPGDTIRLLSVDTSFSSNQTLSNQYQQMIRLISD